MSGDHPEHVALARAFTDDLLAAYHRLAEAHGYRAERFHRLVSKHGGERAAETVLSAPDPPPGFHRLRVRGLLAFSIEAHVLRPPYEALFSEEQRTIARRRLEHHGFDVDGFLDALGDGSAPPEAT